MTIVLGVVMCLAAPFVAYWVYSLIADYNTNKLLSYEEWSDRFFSLAGRLLDRDDLPEEWVETISFLNNSIDDETMSKALERTFGKERQESIAAEASESVIPPDVDNFIDKNPELSRSYVSATRAAFLAMTFLAPFNVGAEIRAKMAEEWERRRSRDRDPGLAIKEVQAVKKASHLKLVHSVA
jgi:hypothetical protein